MKKLIGILVALVLVGCSETAARNLAKVDLVGQPLTADDFTIIIGDRVAKDFYTKAEIRQAFPGIQGVEKKIWRWSVLDPNGGASNFPSVEYQIESVRFVYFDFLNAQEANTYTGLGKGSLTIRGIEIGDSVDKVLGQYGKSYFGNEAKETIHKGESGLIYRFYNYPESSNTRYPLFDFIHFEVRDGVVVGIHFWRKQSDAE